MIPYDVRVEAESRSLASRGMSLSEEKPGRIFLLRRAMALAIVQLWELCVYHNFSSIEI
jgi:hypothetical protein